jgi:predicted nucleic acid-binding protein
LLASSKKAWALRDLGAEVVVGNLLDLDAMHRVIAGGETMYFGLSVPDAYLAATVTAAAVAKHHGDTVAGQEVRAAFRSLRELTVL